MRDSALKRFLVRAYFSAQEVRHGLTGAFVSPPLLQPADYERYWELRGNTGPQPRFEIIANGIAAGASVLDVGCGDGTLLKLLLVRRAVSGMGLDPSAVAVGRARAQGVEARVQSLAELRRLEPETRFDHVVMTEVLEHVADPESLALEGWALARRSLWLSFPNIAYFPHRLRLLAGRFPVQWVVFPGEHLRFWSIPDFHEFLSALRLPPPRVIPSNGIVLLGLHRLWPKLLANQIVVRLDKPADSG